MTWDVVYAALGELDKQDVERLRTGAARACALLDKIQERLGVAETNPVAILKAIDQRDARIAQLEAEIADLIHPHDLAAYRAKKSLHK